MSQFNRRARKRGRPSHSSYTAGVVQTRSAREILEESTVHKALFLIATLVFIASLGSRPPAGIKGPVQTESGLLEAAETKTAGVQVFKGVPYAAPPVGELRWRPPQPPAKWEGVRKASRFSDSC